MEKLKPVFLAILVGCGCAFYLFRNVELKSKNEVMYNAVAVQIGVFKDLDNATSMKDSLGGIICKDDDLYRVYYSILKNDDNIEFITDYLEDKGINYYIKSLKLNDETVESTKEYETLMSKTNEESKLAINEKILNLYKDVI